MGPLPPLFQNITCPFLHAGLRRPHLLGLMPRLLVRDHQHSNKSTLLTIASTVDSFLDPTSRPPIPPSARSSQSTSSAISRTGRKSSYQMPSRSATSPIPIPPSSPLPDLSISQDSAFPRFPTSKSRSVTPTTPLTSSFPFPHRNRTPPRTENDAASQLLDVRNTHNGNMIQSMNGTAPETFKRSAKAGSQRSGHRKSNSMSSSQDFSRPTSSRTSPTHHQRPSTSSSNYTGRPSISSASGNSRFTLERSKTDVPAVPAVPLQGKDTQRKDTTSATIEQQTSESAFDFGSFGQDHRSQTFPTDDDHTRKSNDAASMHRRPSEPTVNSHKPRPSVAAVMQPLYSIGSTSSFKSTKSVRGRSTAPLLDRTASSTPKNISRARDDGRLEDAPPIPLHTQVQSLGSDNSRHTPHESTSSNESYSSGRKTGSSRSSPPLHDSTDDSRIGNMFNGFQFDVDRRSSFEEPASSKEDTRTESLKPRPSKPPASAYHTIQTLSPYGKSSSQEETPITSPEDYLASSFTAHSDSSISSSVPPGLVPPPTLGSSGQERPMTANKGNCKGCGELIKGKSVRAEDGRRLTGRYHKQCFVCKTCQAPFPSADFYVMHNHPYCARHYHELNNSLCKNCDRGIEGPYLETEQQHKFHPHCFSCQECHRILRKDYFEFDGRTLCEQHAHRAAQQPSSLGPGRRFPERRTTRLMMM